MAGGAVDLYLCCTGCCLFAGPPLSTLVNKWGTVLVASPLLIQLRTDLEPGEKPHTPAGFNGCRVMR